MRSPLECRKCGERIAHKHEDGRLDVDTRTGVTLHERGVRGPYLRLVCACGSTRDYQIPCAIISAPALTRESMLLN